MTVLNPKLPLRVLHGGDVVLNLQRIDVQSIERLPIQLQLCWCTPMERLSTVADLCEHRRKEADGQYGRDENARNGERVARCCLVWFMPSSTKQVARKHINIGQNQRIGSDKDRISASVDNNDRVVENSCVMVQGVELASKRQEQISSRKPHSTWDVPLNSGKREK